MDIHLRSQLGASSPPLSKARDLATKFGHNPPISLRRLLLASDVRTFHQVITTPAGTALGGSLDLKVAGDGTYTFSGHMHGSGFDSYSFRIHAFLRGSRIGISLQTSGTVGGTTGEGSSRDFDWLESGHRLTLQENWEFVRDGELIVLKSYEDTGFLSVIEDIANGLVAFVLAQTVVAPHIAAFLVIGSEFGQLTDVHFAQPHLLSGVVVAGGAILLLGPSVIIPAVIAGVAVGAQFQSRLLNEAEKTFARTVFADTLPFSRIYVTNLKNPTSTRAFCTAQPDGSILINLGDAFDAPIGDPLKPLNPADAGRRTTFVHELVHAWQIAYRAFPPDMLWIGALNHIRGDEVYEWDVTGWANQNIEAQAKAIAYWYEVFSPLPGGLNSAAAMSGVLYDYVANHIRIGQN